MTKNKKTALSLSCYRRPNGRLGGIGLFCALIILSGCDSQYMPRLPAALTGETKSEGMTDSTSHMQPSSETSTIIPAAPREQMNPKNLFGKSLRSDEERLDRLERAVQDMRNEFNNVKPSIRRLMAIEGDIQNLISELQALSENPGLARSAPAKAAPVGQPMPLTAKQPAKPVPTPQKVKSAPQPTKTVNRPDPNGDTGVYSVRVGEHPGKTRIVLDVGKTKTFRTDIDNNEKIMIVELPDAKWTAAKSQSFRKSSFISSYKVEESGNGHMMILQLKRAAKIGYEAEIGSVNGKGRRIVIDLVNG